MSSIESEIFQLQRTGLTQALTNNYAYVDLEAGTTKGEIPSRVRKLYLLLDLGGAALTATALKVRLCNEALGDDAVLVETQVQLDTNSNTANEAQALLVLDVPMLLRRTPTSPLYLGVACVTGAGQLTGAYLGGVA